VRSGKVTEVAGLAARDLHLIVPRAGSGQVKVEVKVPQEITAPVKKGQVVGEVVVMRGAESLGRVDVVAAADVESSSWLAGWF
jgi:D-alanyl-D-alanine carboxypeptidase (penicillin-binding protein 5/6)